MYRAPSKRRQRLKLIAIYSVMTLGVASLVTLLVFVMLGYRFNRDTSSIQQGGLVQFASRPTGADVTIGAAKLGARTPSKITVNPGSYGVTMNRKGYHQWTKTVDVRPGEVLWLNYAQLVPETITTKAVVGFDSVAAVKASPNGDHFALLAKADASTLTFVDVTSDTPKRTSFDIPAASLPTGTPYSLGLSDWASDSDRLIVSVKYGKSTDYLLVDRRSAERTVNLSKTYESDIADLMFDPRASDRLFLRTSGGQVRRIDTGSDSLSSVLASNVTDMSVYGNDALLLVQTLADVGQTVGYQSFDTTDIRELKQVDSKSKVMMAASKYFSDPYVAVTVGSQLDIYRVKSLPSSDSDEAISMTSVFSATLPAQANHLSIRSGGRFVIAQYPGGVQTYDLELSKQTLTAFTGASQPELRWLDKYHFYTTSGAKLEVMEFDGANAHAIAPLTTAFDAVQSDDGKYIFSVNKTETGFALQRSQMILD